MLVHSITKNTHLNAKSLENMAMVLAMRTRFEVKENKRASRKYFVEGRENGKRSRKLFKTKAEATAYSDLKNIELKNDGLNHAEFDSRLRLMAQDCAYKAGWSWGCVSALDSSGRTIWIADAHRGDGNRFVVHADEKLTAFLELESAIRACGELL